jgi:hypothetical protein
MQGVQTSFYNGNPPVGGISPATATTQGDGMACATYAAKTAGPDLITVWSNGVKAFATVKVTPKPPSLPDLAFMQAWIEPPPGVPKPKQPFVAYFRYQNKGNATSQPCTVRIQLDGLQYIDLNVGSCAPGAQNTVNWPFEKGLGAGNHYFAVYLDVKNVVAEGNEGNNTYCYKFSVR